MKQAAPNELVSRAYVLLAWTLLACILVHVFLGNGAKQEGMRVDGVDGVDADL